MLMKTAKSAARARAKRTRADRRRSVRAPSVTIQYATPSRTVPAERELRKWVCAALRSAGRITVRLVGIREGRELNRAYRGKDYATNVLTFALTEPPPYEGDIALCAPVVSREARAQRKALSAHYAHLVVHGVLHLRGYGHDSELDADAMEKMETRILKRLGYPDPYAALS